MIKGVILDLDGTVYMGEAEVPGAARFVARTREQGIRCLFVTNRGNRRPEVVRDHLRGYGIDCDIDDILTVAQATALYLEKGSAYCIGEDGLTQALIDAGFEITEEAPDYVIVSFDRFFTYDKLKTACRLIGNGSQFIATNPDQALRTEKGVCPGTGAIVAAVAAGSGAQPVMIGKPERHIIEMALKKFDVPKENVIVVGDNLVTDVQAGERAGLRTVLMLTGVSSRDDLVNSVYQPTWVAENYDELEQIVFDHQ